MSHLPIIPEVIVVDFLPKPAEIQGLISQRLPGLEPPPAHPWGRPSTPWEVASPKREQGFILLDFLPSLGALSEVIKDQRLVTAGRRGGY